MWRKLSLKGHSDHRCSDRQHWCSYVYIGRRIVPPYARTTRAYPQDCSGMRTTRDKVPSDSDGWMLVVVNLTVGGGLSTANTMSLWKIVALEFPRNWYSERASFWLAAVLYKTRPVTNGCAGSGLARPMEAECYTVWSDQFARGSRAQRSYVATH